MTNGYVADIKQAAKESDFYRSVIYTATKSQLVLMSLRPGQEIGMEVHDGDQIIYLVKGKGSAVLDGSKSKIEKGSIVFVPAGTQHNIINDDDEAMKLFTIYSPPQHAAGTVQRQKPAEDLEENFAK